MGSWVNDTGLEYILHFRRRIFGPIFTHMTAGRRLGAAPSTAASWNELESATTAQAAAAPATTAAVATSAAAAAAVANATAAAAVRSRGVEYHTCWYRTGRTRRRWDGNSSQWRGSRKRCKYGDAQWFCTRRRHGNGQTAVTQSLDVFFSESGRSNARSAVIGNRSKRCESRLSSEFVLCEFSSFGCCPQCVISLAHRMQFFVVYSSYE